MIFPIILHHDNSLKYTKDLELLIAGREYDVIDSSYLQTKFTESFNIALIKSFKKKEQKYTHLMICNNDINLNASQLNILDNIVKNRSGIFSPSVNSPHSSVMSPSGPGELREVPWIEFICPILSFDVFDDVGYLDMSMSYGWGVELDYCYRAKVLGYKTYLIQNVRIQHYEHRSQDDHSKYSHLANAEMNGALSSKYGDGWQQKLKYPQW